MTVSELIELLKKCPQDQEVVIASHHSNEYCSWTDHEDLYEVRANSGLEAKHTVLR